MGTDEKPKSFWLTQGYAGNGRPVRWAEMPVTGETSRSWIVGTPGGWDERKIPKRGPWPRRNVARSRAEVDALLWADRVRTEIYSRALRIHSAEVVEVVRMARALGIEVPNVLESVEQESK